MAKIAKIRIDYRLIHGQVVARWLKETQATKIIIVNDMLVKDKAMGNIYRMATPAGVRCAIVSMGHFMESWKETQLGDGVAMVLFKDVNTLYACWQNGFRPDEVQIGGMGAGPERKIVYQNMALNKEDFDMLNEMAKDIDIYFQATPEDKKKDYADVAKNVSF